MFYLRRFLLRATGAKTHLQQWNHYYGQPQSTLTVQEMSIALRPFYFAVHPDLFWQHPEEKVVNENSLKHLNSYLESLQNKVKPVPANLTFYIRFTGEGSSTQERALRTINVTLNSQNVHSTIHNLLTKCDLSTEFLDKLRASTPTPPPGNVKDNNVNTDTNIFWKRMNDMTVDKVSEKIIDVQEVNLRVWLDENVKKAHVRNRACEATRMEIERLSHVLTKVLELRDIIWDCGWGVSQFRACLNSFYNLLHQYPIEMAVLRDRTLVFGTQTGVSLDGHIILSSGDVKHWWIDLLRSVPSYDKLLEQLPDSEHELSEVLRGIQIDHRKFQPTVMIQNYIGQLKKLTSALYKYRWQKGLPENWPRRMDQFQLVVECEAGPLMLSPTGQFIAPASCPAFLLVSFISENLIEAQNRMKKYERDKFEESHVYQSCLNMLDLRSLHKDNNVTPALMINCCQRLLFHSDLWSRLLRDSHLRVSTFYSVLQDGEICIPWNWKDDFIA